MNRAAALSRVSTFSTTSNMASRASRMAVRSVRSYSTEAQPSRLAGSTRLLLYTTAGATIFYAVSTVAALNNDRYQDFFVESVPGGERIIDYLDTHDVGQEIKNVNLGGYGEHAVNATKHAYGSVSGAVGRVLSGEEASEIVQGERDARVLLGEVEAKAKAQVSKVADKVHEISHEAKEKSQAAIKAVEEKTASLVHQAKEAADKVEAKVREQATLTAEKVEAKVEAVADKAKETAAAADARAIKDKQPYLGELPLNHEPPAGYVAARKDRGLEPPKQNNARLRPDPQTPKLPLLAPSVQSLSASEPMIAQLAGTIDELATFLKETPSSGTVARGVLESAQIDLQQLSKRLESIKEQEAKRVEKSLADQAARYEAQISKQATEAANKLSTRESDWQKLFEEEHTKQVQQFKEKFEKELATQSNIINERLKEEVIAQGIELQRRWMKDIKAKVEEERGGRLAKLDELAIELKSLEKVTLDNSSALDENVAVHTLWTALRAVQSVFNDESSKKPFRDQLRVLRNTTKARQDQVISAALEVIDNSSSADQGIESFATLKAWYTDKVAPKVRSVALVPLPESAGVLSILASTLLSPLLFHVKGLVPGTDVPSILSRTEYYLDRKDLDSATRELNQLNGWSKLLVSDWINAARNRLEIEQALDIVQTQATFASLMVSV